MYNTAYSDQSHIPRVLDYTVQYDWLGKIAEKRSMLDEQSYRYIDDLKNKALNIRMLNQAGQKKVDTYNDEVEQFFKSNDMSNLDLADYKTSNKYTDIFRKMANDSTLVQTYQVDKQIQSTWNTWKEAAKNPAKTGFSDANYIVWQNEHLLPYMQEGDFTKLPTYNSGTFDPKYDYQKELKGLKSQVHFDGKKFEVTNKDGSKQVVDIQELTPEKLMNFFEGSLSSEATNQMIKEAKAGFYQNYNQMNLLSKTNLANSLYEQDKATYDKYKDLYQKEKEKLEGRFKVASPEEQIGLKSQIEQLDGQIKRYTFNNTLDEYTSLSKVGLANQYAARSLQRKLEKYAQGMSYQVKKVTEELDKNWWESKKYNFDVNKENYDRSRDKIKDAQWQLDYDLKVQKEVNDVYNDELKAAKASGKSKANSKIASDSNGFFSGFYEGETVSGKTTVEEIDNILNSVNNQLKAFQPQSLTKESLKAILNSNDNNPVNATIKSYARQNGWTGYNSPITDNMVGIVSQHLKNSLENGQLKSHYDSLKTQQRLYSSVKDNSWNKLANEHEQLRDLTNEQRLKFFQQNPSIAKQFKTAWETEITSNFQSVRGNDLIIDVNKEKNDNYNRNVNLVLATINSDKAKLKELGFGENEKLTPEMISGATYSPLTGKTSITLKGDPNKNDDDKNGLAGRTLSIQTPQSIREQYGVDFSQKDKVAQMTGYYDGQHKGATYKISKDDYSGGWFIIIQFPDGTQMNTAGGYVNGKYTPPSPIQSNSVEQLEQKVIDIINKRQ